MDYSVVLANVEGNEDLVSVTGKVNGVQMAARVKTRLLGLPAPRLGDLLAHGRLEPSALPKSVSGALAGALVDAFLGQTEKGASPGAVNVSR